jgi:hypothetical protein
MLFYSLFRLCCRKTPYGRSVRVHRNNRYLLRRGCCCNRDDDDMTYYGLSTYRPESPWCQSRMDRCTESIPLEEVGSYSARRSSNLPVVLETVTAPTLAKITRKRHAS